MGALARRQVVILGELHNRPRYWALNASLVRDPAFARRAGVIYMELPNNDQALVEQFLAAPKCDRQPIIETLRDMMWMGWPDQGMLDFFKAVWGANQALPKQQRLRVVLVDMKRPWKEITKPADWEKYRVDRDQFMAENVLRDLREHSSEPRHALFIQWRVSGGLPVRWGITESEQAPGTEPQNAGPSGAGGSPRRG